MKGFCTVCQLCCYVTGKLYSLPNTCTSLLDSVTENQILYNMNVSVKLYSMSKHVWLSVQYDTVNRILYGFSLTGKLYRFSKMCIDLLNSVSVKVILYSILVNSCKGTFQYNK